MQDGRFTVPVQRTPRHKRFIAKSGWTCRFCSVAKPLGLSPRGLQFYAWAEFPQAPIWGSESHTPTRQPNRTCVGASNKRTREMQRRLPSPSLDVSVYLLVRFCKISVKLGFLGLAVKNRLMKGFCQVNGYFLVISNSRANLKT
jgi:hypothetical protein